MRRSVVLQVLALPSFIALLAACETTDSLRGLQRPPPAVAMERRTPPLVPVSPDGAGSTIALVRLGNRSIALVADRDARVVRLLDTRTEEELPVTELGGEPSQLVVGGDGRVFVGLRDAAEVDVLEQVPGETLSLRVAARVATAEEPTGLALTPDGRTLLVACGWGHELDAFATSSLLPRFRADVAREPRSVVTSEDGVHAYVSHATASLVSVVDLDSPEHAVEGLRLDEPDPVHDGQTIAWRQGYALARTSFGVLAPGVTVNAGDTTVRSETYGGVDESMMPAESASLALLREHKPGGNVDAAAPPHMLSPRTSCLLPRAAAYDPQGEWLLVACQGQDVVSRVDARPERAVGGVAEWKVGGEPTGIALDAERRVAFVWAQRSHTVTSIPVDAFHPYSESPDDGLSRTVALGPRVDMADELAAGRALFHATGDARISSDGRACASCHPDGRDDGLVWATPDGPRQTPTLAGRLAGTAPYGWNGARSTVKTHVKGTLKRLGGTGLDDAAMTALVDYCLTMKAPPRAADAAAGQDPRIAEGRDLFEASSTGCASCHMSDGTFTDGNRHDVKSKAKGDPGRRFDTPSLRFVAGTAPYFHDGRYPTLRALLVGSDGRMGHTRQLSRGELDALEAYLTTL